MWPCSNYCDDLFYQANLYGIIRFNADMSCVSPYREAGLLPQHARRRGVLVIDGLGRYMTSLTTRNYYTGFSALSTQPKLGRYVHVHTYIRIRYMSHVRTRVCPTFISTSVFKALHRPFFYFFKSKLTRFSGIMGCLNSTTAYDLILPWFVSIPNWFFGDVTILPITR